MPDERGAHAEAARARERALAQQLRVTSAADTALTTSVRDARSAARRSRRRLDAIGAQIESAVAGQRALSLDTPAGARRFSGFLTARTQDIAQVMSDATADDRAAAALLQALSERYSRTDDAADKPRIQAVDNRTTRDDPARRKNQIDAFTRVFGREPVSPTDWASAAALDCHTYSPEYQGVNSEVRIARIRPQPGRGVVRVSQWIAQREVKSGATSRNFGNDRGPDPQFDPENTKVTTYLDYENGIVVLRQNPSVEQAHDGSPGQVKIGVPRAGVMQADDGSVRIKYDAANPFAPGYLTNPPGPLNGHRLTVNGDLVFTPEPGGVRVDGTRTNYPSLEVYQDAPNGKTHPVLIDPARSGSTSVGPPFNLPRHHDIGAGGHAFERFDTGRWNPVFDVRTPLPSNGFGPAGALLPAPPLPGPRLRVPA